MDAFLQIVWRKKVVFLGTFFLVFTMSYVALLALDFLPEEPVSANVPADVEIENLEEVTDPAVAAEETVQGESAAALEAAAAIPAPETQIEPAHTADQAIGQAAVESYAAVLPVSISIAKIGKVVPVLNPTSRAVADLDEALLAGVVRHPDSADLSQDGNVFILGHSSYLPQVFNKNFQAFNGIQNLEWGDTIEVYSDDAVYEYRVEKVYRAQASDLTVPIAGTGKMLTLATCNSFGSVDDRYIVEAKQMVTRSL